MTQKKFRKFLAGLTAAVMVVSTGALPAIASSQFDDQAETESFSAAEETEIDTEFAPEEEAVFSSEAEDPFGTEAEETEGISLAGMPVLAESLTDNTGDIIPLAQYLALGDSISTGYGLEDKSGSFVNLLAKKQGFTVSCGAMDGAVSQMVLGLLATGQFDAQISEAELITLTVGGNDMMAVFYQIAADAYNAATGDSVTALEIPVILSTPSDPRNAALTASTLQIIAGGYEKVQPAFSPALAAFGENLKNITAYIKGKNPNAVILVANQYNPYKWLSAPYSVLGAFFNGGVTELNAQISNAANGAGTVYTVVDAYSAFAVSQENLCNASSQPLNLDFHPNSAGHAVLASLFETAVPSKGLGKVILNQPQATGNRVNVSLAQPVDDAQGYDYVISEDPDCITAGEYLQVCKNQKDSDGDFYYIPEGSYYVYCHAWMRGEDGKKQFGDWSEAVQVTVSSVTPQQPNIQKVTVKGNTVTLTYTQCKDADGYDAVLGTTLQKINGEKRPTAYGTNVVKIKKGNVVTLTFKNVKKGTYYAGVHAYNRTSENGKKVFSPWSAAKKVVVK
ncbi:MAG: GDSL-type esterase/lipase family protein [Eubacteriales bacterium]|nr:GDSL-type esterase/lipase family protein [Eubacteriales bacterium]